MLKDCFRDLLQPPTQSTAANTHAAQRAQRHAQFKPMLRSSPQLQQVLQGVATIAQIILLEPVHNGAGKAGRATVACSASEDSAHPETLEGSICVVNTHFFFHPNASHVRNMHAAAIMSEVQAFMQEQSSQGANSNSHDSTALLDADNSAKSEKSDTAEGSFDHSRSLLSTHAGSGSQPTLVFSGDLNSDLNDGTSGTQPCASADGRHADSQESGSAPQPALLFCGDLNCGMSHGTPGSTCKAAVSCLTTVEQGQSLRPLMSPVLV